MSIRKQIFFHLVSRGLAITGALGRVLPRLDSFLGGAALAGMDSEELKVLTSHIYDSMGDLWQESLFEWEKKWFEQYLGPGVDKLLIGGAGAGREVKYFLEQNKEIVAFDGSPRLARLGKKKYSDTSTCVFLSLTYEDLFYATSSDAAKGRGLVMDMGPYDAVLLGWGSFTHLTTHTDRVALLSFLREICPSGPVLLSFWMADSQEDVIRSGQADRLGRRLGAVIAGAGDKWQAERRWDKVSCLGGFGHYFTEEEIRQISQDAGYKVAYLSTSGGKPHATLTIDL